MDLSRNRLEGIEPLLQVPVRTEGSSTKDGGGHSEEQQDDKSETGEAAFAYPLAGVLELRLNGCVRRTFAHSSVL